MKHQRARLLIPIICASTFLWLPLGSLSQKTGEKLSGNLVASSAPQEFRCMKGAHLKGEEKTNVSIWDLSDLNIKNNDDCKWEIEATWFAIGDPVHETLTIQGLQQAKLSIPTQEFIRGVFWNDDPCAQLLMEDDTAPLRPSFGFAWYFDFKDAESLAKRGNQNYQSLGCPTLGRSHFGDLQFLHAMAAQDSIEAGITLDKIMGWAELTYRIAVGDISDRTKLKDVRDVEFTEKLLGDLASRSASEIFRSRTRSATQKRAIGSLLHMIQDSYAPSHVLRESSGTEFIKQFHSYARQDHRRHAEDDAWRSGGSDQDRIDSSPGARSALDASTKILTLYKDKAPWGDVQKYLESGSGPFVLHKEAIPSGPGSDYALQD